MRTVNEIIDSLKSGDGSAASARMLRVADAFQRTFRPAEDTPAILASGPGRTEIGGNHTDHQHGHVLCASVDLDVLCCAAPNGLDQIRVCSEGFGMCTVALDSLLPREDERGATPALVRGVAAKVAELGHPLRGIDIYAVSDVLSGSGLSSSAAFETLLGNVLNHFCAAGALDAVTIAKIGQYAENVYFGKPCGLMDQMGSSVGGAVEIDFAAPASPKIERIDYDFSRSGHSLCIIDTVSTHADLTDDYAGIPREMCAVAAYFGKRVLREVEESEFRTALPALRRACGDRAVLRAMHYFADDRRVTLEAEALKRGDFRAFLRLVNESGLSSALRLENTWSAAAPGNQAIPMALAIGAELLDGSGAIRVHGGGFAGTVQAWVPDGKLDDFRRGIEAVFGEGTCHILHIRPVGGCVISE